MNVVQIPEELCIEGARGDMQQQELWCWQKSDTDSARCDFYFKGQ